MGQQRAFKEHISAQRDSTMMQSSINALVINSIYLIIILQAVIQSVDSVTAMDRTGSINVHNAKIKAWCWIRRLDFVSAPMEHFIAWRLKHARVRRLHLSISYR